MSEPEVEASVLLRRMNDGDIEAESALYRLVYSDLHSRARRIMGPRAAGGTLQPTALVHEAWMRIAGGERRWNGREHFLRLSMRAMRCALVDYVRSRSTAKRAGTRQELEDVQADVAAEDDHAALLALHDALEQLGELDADMMQVAELRIFGGLKHEEVAEVLGVSSRSVDRIWSAAREHLRRLTGPDADG